MDSVSHSPTSLNFNILVSPKPKSTMFVAKFASQATARSFAARAMSTKKVAVLGAGGGIGQPLSMLLKLSPLVDELACYDIVGTPGVAADLSHVSDKGVCQETSVD
jgi:malate dehydrogenase